MKRIILLSFLPMLCSLAGIVSWSYGKQRNCPIYSDLAALITTNVLNSIGQEREKKSVSDMEVASRLSQKNNPTLKSRVYKL